MVLQGIISKYTIIENYAEYTIEIKDNSTGESWQFHRRYSVLRKWHNFSSQALKSLPEFPKKKFFGNLKPLFLEKRKKELEVYINNIIFLYEHPVIKSFIKPNDRKDLFPSNIRKKLKNSESYARTKNIMRKINSKSMENMFDLSDLESTNLGESKFLYGKMIFPLSNKILPIGSYENIESLYTDVYENGHWIRKKFRNTKKIF
ncbi:hypothetical protein SteCoe_1295 [Stentor coeruleus]|uniref:PX domain-containing protein n=1 Tax=Stentor coeruleus TaxID=5963 RepID=A0A1R2D2E0_9CILI|nr:hypothetical protein SteCoe_1295 [Stentor coeruleus]